MPINVFEIIMLKWKHENTRSERTSDGELRITPRSFFKSIFGYPKGMRPLVLRLLVLLIPKLCICSECLVCVNYKVQKDKDLGKF